LACVAAIANLELIQEHMENASRLGDIIRKRLLEMADRHLLIGDVRGLGAMQAIELVRDRKTKVPAEEETTAVIREARNLGVLLLSAGWHPNVIRLLPPLNTPAEAAEHGLDLLDASLAAVEKRA